MGLRDPRPPFEQKIVKVGELCFIECSAAGTVFHVAKKLRDRDVSRGNARQFSAARVNRYGAFCIFRAAFQPGTVRRHHKVICRQNSTAAASRRPVRSAGYQKGRDKSDYPVALPRMRQLYAISSDTGGKLSAFR
jgi:hypothetical protein